MHDATLIEAILRGDEALRSFSEAERTGRLATSKPCEDGPQPGEAAEEPAAAVG